MFIVKYWVNLTFILLGWRF